MDCNPWDPRCKEMDGHIYMAFLPTGEHSTFMCESDAIKWLFSNNSGVGMVHKIPSEVTYFLKTKIPSKN